MVQRQDQCLLEEVSDVITDIARYSATSQSQPEKVDSFAT